MLVWLPIIFQIINDNDIINAINTNISN